MTDDPHAALSARLRERAGGERLKIMVERDSLCDEAADAIDALRAEVAKREEERDGLIRESNIVFQRRQEDAATISTLTAAAEADRAEIGRLRDALFNMENSCAQFAVSQVPYAVRAAARAALEPRS